MTASAFIDPPMGDLRAVYYWWDRYSRICDDIARGRVRVTEPAAVVIRRRRRYFKMLRRAVRKAGFVKNPPATKRPAVNFRLSRMDGDNPPELHIPPMGIKDVVGANIRRLRLDRKLTQEQLAHDAGMATSFLSEIERGKRAATVTTLEGIATALSVQVADLFVVTARERPKGLPRGRRALGT